MATGKQVQSYSLRTVIMFFVIFAVLLFLAFELLFTVRSVAIEGNRRISAEEIADLAGLNEHRSWLLLSEDGVRSGIETNRYLVFDGMEKIFPNRVIVRVKERTPRVWLNALGRIYTMDEEGTVLDVLADESAAQGLMALSGLSVREMRPGGKAAYVNSSQMRAYTDLMSEILVQNAYDRFSSMNVADGSNVYLTSKSGFEISFGKAEDFRAKLLSVRGVLEYADKYGLQGGGLDASVPGYVTYSP